MIRSSARHVRIGVVLVGLVLVAAIGGGISYQHRQQPEVYAPVAPVLPVPLQPAPQPNRLRPSQPHPPAREGITLGTQIGKIEIPRLHLSATLREGADDRQLAVGAGHVPGTAMPGYTGNVAIAAHRDRHFFPLRNVQPNDEVLVQTKAGMFKYLVTRTEIVTPNDVSVLTQTREPELTLITCYPFFFRGHAPKRFIVHAAAEPDLSASR